jgi:hypothetical protein
VRFFTERGAGFSLFSVSVSVSFSLFLFFVGSVRLKPEILAVSWAFLVLSVSCCLSRSY